LNFQQLVKIEKQFSTAEKLKLNDVMWVESMDIPNEQKKIVLNRIQKAKENPNKILN